MTGGKLLNIKTWTRPGKKKELFQIVRSVSSWIWTEGRRCDECVFWTLASSSFLFHCLFPRKESFVYFSESHRDCTITLGVEILHKPITRKKKRKKREKGRKREKKKRKGDGFRGVEERGYWGGWDLILMMLYRHECYHLQKDKQRRQRHSLCEAR